MREHEVPTHVQAEDRVLLGLTFPQIVAVTAVCALAYGAYRYFPVGPSEARMALAVLLGLMGAAMTVGKVEGRRLPLVVADLLRYRLGARRHVGPVEQLVRSEAPAPAQPAKRRTDLVQMLARRMDEALGKLHRRRRRAKNKKRRRGGERRNGRMPLRPQRWLGKRWRGEVDGNAGTGDESDTRGARRRRVRGGVLALAAVGVISAAATVAPGVLAQDRWQDEIGFEVREPVPGRRVFVEGLAVSGDRAAVTLRAATALEVRVRAYGGPDGSWLRFWSAAGLDEGERVDYSLPLHGPVPSFTVSWEDTVGQAGALTFTHEQIPYPLPAVDGDLCDLRVTSLGWVPGAVEGAIASECVPTTSESVSLQMVGGHTEVTETVLLEAGVTSIAGTVSASVGSAHAAVPLTPVGETRFRLEVPDGEAIHPVVLDVRLVASLHIPLPPVTQLTHRPQRTEHHTQTVSMWRPGTSETVSQTATVTNDDGTTTQHVISATLSIPGETVYDSVTVTVVHPERVEAETTGRAPIVRTRNETMALAAAVGADDPFAALALPAPEPIHVPAEQTPLSESERQNLLQLFESGPLL